MKKSLAILMFVVAATFLCGNALALDTYIPHITTGANDWTDYLQVNNNASSTANFTLYLYSSAGAQIYNQSHTVGARSRLQIDLKALNSSAATGKISYTETGLVFRVSYESIGGGVAEFRTIDSLGSNIGFCFSDFTTLVQWKGAAIANMGTTDANITLYALGGSTQGSGGSILANHTETIVPRAKLVGNQFSWSWLGGLDLGQIESIVAVAGSSSLCGIAISGDTALSRLLFTPAAAVSNFNPQAETWDINANVNCGGAFPVTADLALTITGGTCTAVVTTKVIGGAPEVHVITLTGTYDSTTGVGTIPSQVFTVPMSTGTETVTLNGQFTINGNTLTASGNMTVVGPGSAWTCSGTLTATGTK
jgi:hypothetical protein